MYVPLCYTDISTKHLIVKQFYILMIHRYKTTKLILVFIKN
jgi:hypothetical protein